MDKVAKLWLRQVLAIWRLEATKAFRGRRMVGVYFLALAPVLLLGLRAALTLHPQERSNLGLAGVIYAGLFQLFMLRLAIFFGCVGIFTQLFRGEILEKTLHYYLLTPVRREVLVAGKYLSGLAAAVVLFAGSTTATFVLLYVPYGSEIIRDYFSRGPGLKHLGAYIGVTVLACLGYGAVFLLVGLFFRNPMIPAAIVLGWESINFVLPPLLQKISVIHYLQSLCPVAIPAGPFAVLVEPTSAWISVPGVLLVTAAVLFLASLKMRHVEITYSTD
ncbi:MAG TPA: ABC transporter permease [Acidobacteriota bacterium]|jgi:ABC-type transport system involved in multi-copper enzyme maturation permease subunit